MPPDPPTYAQCVAVGVVDVALKGTRGQVMVRHGKSVMTRGVPPDPPTHAQEISARSTRQTTPRQPPVRRRPPSPPKPRGRKWLVRHWDGGCDNTPAQLDECPTAHVASLAGPAPLEHALELSPAPEPAGAAVASVPAPAPTPPLSHRPPPRLAPRAPSEAAVAPDPAHPTGRARVPAASLDAPLAIPNDTKEPVVLAAKTFDGSHRRLYTAAHRLMRNAALDPTDAKRVDMFNVAQMTVRRNRLFVPETLELPVAIPAGSRERPDIPPPQKQWRLEDSIWNGRQKLADSRDFYDNDAVVRRAIECDFRKALSTNSLDEYLLAHDANAPDTSTCDLSEIDDFFAEIEESLVANGRLIYMVFDYYASQGATDDLFHVHRNGYEKMVKQCGVIVKGSKSCDRQHLDLIFVVANTASEGRGALHRRGSTRFGSKVASAATGNGKTIPVATGGSKKVAHDDRHGLTRAELLKVLLRIAIARYVLTGKSRINDVSDAVDELFKTIRKNASREVLQNSMEFRRNFCYTEATDAALQLHKDALRMLFTKYSSGEGGEGAKGSGGGSMTKGSVGRGVGSSMSVDSSQMLSPGEFISLARDVALIGEDLSVQDARLIFMWSRMRVIDEDVLTSRERIENLTFWGFLEAMVRVAQSKALPTDEQVEASGCADGGEFLIKLQQRPTEYSEFVRNFDREWWQPIHQPIAHALKHMLMLVMRTVGDTLKRWEQNAANKAAAKSKGTQQYAPSPPKSPPKARAGLKGEGGSDKSRGRRKQATHAELKTASDALQQQMDGLNKKGGTLSADALGVLGSALDEQIHVQGHAATVINAAVRGKMTRVERDEFKEATISLQRHARGQAVRVRVDAEKRAAVTIESAVRGKRARLVVRQAAMAAAMQRHMEAAMQRQLALEGVKRPGYEAKLKRR